MGRWQLDYPIAGPHVDSTKIGHAAMNSSRRLGIANMNYCLIDPTPTIAVGDVRQALGPILEEDGMEDKG